TQIKLCGMMRPADVLFAASLGVNYVGCVFAGGPRRRTIPEAGLLFAALDSGSPIARVGVFGGDDPEALRDAVARVPLDVVQLHGGGDATSVERARRAGSREVWAVVHCAGGQLPSTAIPLWRS